MRCVEIPLLRRLVWVVVLLAAFALPATAWAHGGGNYTAGDTSAPPTIDGVVSASEWVDARPYSVVFGNLGNGTVRFAHTSTDLYISVVIQDATPGPTPSLGVYFDNGHNGSSDFGDDAWLAATGSSSGSDLFYDNTGPAGPTYSSDVLGNGANDTVAAGTVSGSTVAFELRHPLCTDQSGDICVGVGRSLGVDFRNITDEAE